MCPTHAHTKKATKRASIPYPRTTPRNKRMPKNNPKEFQPDQREFVSIKVEK